MNDEINLSRLTSMLCAVSRQEKDEPEHCSATQPTFWCQDEAEDDVVLGVNLLAGREQCPHQSLPSCLH